MTGSPLSNHLAVWLWTLKTGTSLCSAETGFLTSSALCQHCDTGTDQLRDLSSRSKPGRPPPARPRVEAGAARRTVATATSASPRTAAGLGYLRTPGRPCLQCPQGAPARSGQRPHPVPPQVRRAGNGGRPLPASGGGKVSHRKKRPPKGFVLPFTRAEKAKGNRLRLAGGQDLRVPSASGEAGKALSRERRRGSAGAASARLLPLQVALEAPAERRFPRDGPSGRPSRAASLGQRSRRPAAHTVPTANTCLALPVPFPSSAPSSLLSPSCIWMDACAHRPGLDEAERRRRSQTGGRLRGGACAACACV